MWSCLLRLPQWLLQKSNWRSFPNLKRAYEIVIVDHHTHHAPLAVFLVAEHGLFPLQSSQSAVQVLDQLVSVLQLDQLEGLLSPNAHDDRVGNQAGTLCFFYGQHLRRKRRRQGFKTRSIILK